jgi:RNA polymerase sigma-70 factor (ECF subfamily)
MSANTSTQGWIEQAVRGDRLAFQKLILLHHARLLALARRRMSADVRSRLEPDDLLQQVYADAMLKIDRFEDRGEDSFFSWLARILDSKLIDAQRRIHARARAVAREAAPPRQPSAFASLVQRAAVDSMTPSRVFARRESEALLHAALAGLSDDHRRILELRFIRGLSLARASEEMGRTPAAVQMLCARALRSLRAALRNLSRSL